MVKCMSANSTLAIDDYATASGMDSEKKGNSIKHEMKHTLESEKVEQHEQLFMVVLEA